MTWLLADGSWSDAGVWADASAWQDALLVTGVKATGGVGEVIILADLWQPPDRTPEVWTPQAATAEAWAPAAAVSETWTEAV